MINVHQDYIVIMLPAEPLNQPVGCVPTITTALPACIVIMLPAEPIKQLAEHVPTIATALPACIVTTIPAEPINQSVGRVLTITIVLGSSSVMRAHVGMDIQMDTDAQVTVNAKVISAIIMILELLLVRKPILVRIEAVLERPAIQTICVKTAIATALLFALLKAGNAINCFEILQNTKISIK